jgi:hypothetical protein
MKAVLIESDKNSASKLKHLYQLAEDLGLKVKVLSDKMLEDLEDKALGRAMDAAKKEDLGNVDTAAFKKKIKGLK